MVAANISLNASLKIPQIVPKHFQISIFAFGYLKKNSSKVCYFCASKNPTKQNATYNKKLLIVYNKDFYFESAI